MIGLVVDKGATLRTRNEDDERRLEQFEKVMTFPILTAALLPIMFALAGRKSIVSDIVQIAAWAVFIVDYVVHDRLVPKYRRSGLGIFDLIVVILTAPWFLVPGLGTARFTNVARLARLLRVVQAGGRRLRHLFTQLGEVGLVTGGLIFTCAYVAFSAERGVNDQFGNFGDAIWWATVTVTTVGYGDITPQTAVGRVTAVVLMFSGLGLLGVLAGTLASFFGFGDRPEEATSSASPSEPADVKAELTALRARVADLDAALAALEDRLP